MSTNSRIGISQNLPPGATYDLLLVDNPEGYPQGQLFFQFETTPRKITGIQKVAQLFFKILFTTKGIDPLQPSQGTLFPYWVKGGNIKSTDSAFVANVTEAIMDAAAQVKGILNSANGDPSSQLSNISILGMSSLQDTLGIYLQLTTLGGETASIAVPFPQLNLPISVSG